MTRTLYYFNCQILDESFLYNLLPTIVFFAIKPYFARAQLVRFYHVVGHLINVCVEFYCVARFLSMM